MSTVLSEEVFFTSFPSQCTYARLVSVENRSKKLMQGLKPKSGPKLQRPSDPKDVLLIIAEGQLYITGTDEVWAAKVMELVGNGEIHTEKKKGGVILRSCYTGSETGRRGKIVVRHRGAERFKLVAIEDTPDSLLKDCAALLADELEPEECGRHGLVFRGHLRKERKDKEVISLAPIALSPLETEKPASNSASRPRLPIKEVRAKCGQKTVIAKSVSGKDFSGTGPKDECRKIGEKISKSGPRFEPAGNNFEVKGTFGPAFLEENEKNSPPDADGNVVRIDGKVISVFGDHFDAVKQLLERRCKSGTVLVVLVGKTDADYRIIGSGQLMVGS